VIEDAGMLVLAYLMSFPVHDTCGDEPAGIILRRAILEKLKACPYSAAAREKAKAEIIDQLSQLTSELIRHRGETPWADKILDGTPTVRQ